MIKLWDQEKLKFIDDKVGDIYRRKENNISVIIKDFCGQKIQTNPHCNMLTSLARLLSTCEICGCLYYKSEEKKFSLSTNVNQMDNRKKFRNQNFVKTRNKKNFQENEVIFRESIANKIMNFIDSNFSDENRLEIYRESFPQTINKISKSPSFRIIMENSENVKEKEICSLIIEITSRNWKKEDFELNQIESLRKKLDSFWKESKESRSSFKKDIALILTYLDDIKKICDDLQKEEYRWILDSILESRNSWSERYNSVSNLHCELAAIQKESKEISLKEILHQVSTAIERKRFTVSKFCCFICSLVFETFANIYNQDSGEKISFEYLGNSCVIFPGCKSPEIKDCITAKATMDMLIEKFDMIQRRLNCENEKQFIDDKKFIENSEYQYIIVENSKYSVTNSFEWMRKN